MIILAERRSPFGTIRVFEAKGSGSVLYCQGGVNQSEADRRGVSTASYIHAIYGLLRQSRCDDVLMIGCGGGTLATMLAAVCRRVTVVDINPDAIFLAREYFGMPQDVISHARDGREFLLSNAAVYDAIVLDAFRADKVPAHLRTRSFFRLARSRLAEHGRLFANIYVLDDRDSAPDETCGTMAEVWPEVRLLDRVGYSERNAIAMAGDVTCLTSPRILVPPEVSASVVETELASMDFRSWRTRI